MYRYHYEIHKIPDPSLPFLYHRHFRVDSICDSLNWHENIELLWCIEGSGFVQCGSQRTDFQQGDVFVVNADTPHNICSTGQVVYRCLIIDNRFFAENKIPVSSLCFRDAIREEAFFALLEEVAAAYGRYPQGLCATADIRYCVLGVVRMLCSRYVSKPRQAPVFQSHVKTAVLYLKAHFSRPVSLDDLADHVGISKYHLCRQFRLYTGSSIVKTLNHIRCTEARQMLERGASVQTAAMACGFDNLSYFSRTFKQFTDCLPSQIRKA